ncbi:hypothetical protein G6F46_014245 [Rhizopus delemar]|nr:hypothetical protein G6F46_014245 [Rhizopus delemar]
MHESGSDSSSTRATLTEGTITIGGRKTTAAELGVNTDAAAAHRALEAMPDANKMLADQQAMANAASTVLATSKQIASDIGSYGINKITDAYLEGKSAAEKEAFAKLSPKDHRSGHPTAPTAVRSTRSPPRWSAAWRGRQGVRSSRPHSRPSLRS